MIKANTLSPHFYFSKFRHPQIGGLNTSFSKFQDSRIWVQGQKCPIIFTINFFNYSSRNVLDYSLRNKTLSLLSTHSKYYQSLTQNEKKINLKFYGLHRSFYNILQICRPPLLFYVKRKAETDGTTRERMKYEHFFIEYNWKLFTISIKGKTEKLKFIFLVSSLY
jgi:hypothetical protein